MSGSVREDLTHCTNEASFRISDTSLAFKDQETGMGTGREGLRVIRGT